MMHYERPKITTYKPGDVRKYAHLKRDGIMITVIGHGSQDHMPTCLTRHPDGAHEIQLGGQPGDVLYNIRRREFNGALFCELFAPGEEASQVKSHLANREYNSLRMECFAIPSQSANLSLESLRDYCKVLHVPFVDFERVDCDSVEPFIQAWSVVTPPDYEGHVFKDGNLLNWCKWKPVLTADLIIIGYKEGKGKYLGTLGALELGIIKLEGDTEYYEHICNCSGMDDATRDLISENEEKYLGTVIEVTYQRRDSAGGLRHPRFKGFREDKGAHECTTI